MDQLHPLSSWQQQQQAFKQQQHHHHHHQQQQQQVSSTACMSSSLNPSPRTPLASAIEQQQHQQQQHQQQQQQQFCINPTSPHQSSVTFARLFANSQPFHDATCVPVQSLYQALQPLLGAFTAPAMAVLHFIGEIPSFAHSCPCVPTGSGAQSFPQDIASAPSRCGRRSDGTALVCAASLSHAMNVLNIPPASLSDALSGYLSELQQPHQSLRLRSLFRSAFLYQSSKSKCLAIPDAVTLLQYLLAPDTVHLRGFIAFIQRLYISGRVNHITCDQWCQLLRFVHQVGPAPEFSGYSEDWSWPTLLDDFVEFSRLCAEQRPLKRDEVGGFIFEGKESRIAAVGGLGESDMDDGQPAHHHTQHHQCKNGHFDIGHNRNHEFRPQSGQDILCNSGEERLVESLGAVAINKRRRID